MPTRSSLELMLEKLQQPEENPIEDIPPPLPVRPVSRARPRRRNSPVNGGSLGFERKKEDLIDGADGENWIDKAEKGICKIQKCYRGHQVLQCYKGLRQGVIALQSFIRGEIARRGYHQHTTTSIIQKQTTKYFDHQSVDRSRGSLVDLEKQVLKTEAKLRGKREENMALKKKLLEIEKKWQQYEERMKSMEKEWQEQLTYIQECLVAAKKNHTITVTSGRMIEIPMNSNCNREEDRVCLKLRPNEELLRKLKLRFKSWKKEYKNKLRDAQRRTSSGTGNAAKSHNNWWGRLSHHYHV